ncbi:unnamed protein product [Rotaria sp. Silwood1]|nr:unnamed protein product [Rotaria sp. Silwood1]
MYEYCRTAGITLFTVSHRKSLWKYHELQKYIDMLRTFVPYIIYTLLQRPNKNTNSLNNEQTIIDSSSIISSSDNILIELVEE